MTDYTISDWMQEFVAQVRQRLNFFQSTDLVSIPSPPEPAQRGRKPLVWQAATTPPVPTYGLEEVRRLLAEKMTEYMHRKRPGKLLLLQVQPGVGKTHLGSKTAQNAALAGKKVLYAMPTHKHFETLAEFPHFNPAQWYHWRSFGAESPVTGNPMCLYDREMALWTKKGYPAMKLCDSLCQMYKAQCEYRRQARVENPIIAGTHDHIALGMSISNFDVCFTDELPIRAFLRPRHIPKEGLRVRDAIGPSGELVDTLLDLTGKITHALSGKALLDQLGPLLDDVYAQFEEDIATVKIPWVQKPADVEAANWWYLPDLLLLLTGEYAAWKQGAHTWLDRVVLTPQGLDLLKRADVWDELPTRIIALDATGNPQVYKQLFGREVEVFAPKVARVGKVYQITQRLNGISQLLTHKNGKQREALKPLQEAFDFCENFIKQGGYTKPGFVTYMDIIPLLKARFPDAPALYFYNQRGDNTLKGCDVGFLLGAPQPPDHAIMRQTKMLWHDRTLPFYLIDLDEVIVPEASKKPPERPLRTERLQPYQYFEAGKQPFILTAGLWDGELENMAQVYREQEIIQGLHRFRPITEDTVVVILSNLPTSEPLDGLFLSYAEALAAPVPDWQGWQKALRWIEENPGLVLGYTKREGIDMGLDELLGRSVKSLQNEKWLERLLEVMPETEVVSISTGRGRPTQGIKQGIRL